MCIRKLCAILLTPSSMLAVGRTPIPYKTQRTENIPTIDYYYYYAEQLSFQSILFAHAASKYNCKSTKLPAAAADH